MAAIYFYGWLAVQALIVIAASMSLSSPAVAAALDFSPLTDPFDMHGAIGGVLVIAAALAALWVVQRGALMLLMFITGTSR